MIKSQLTADASQAIFEPTPENWRRPTWMKYTHDDLSLLDLGIHGWRRGVVVSGVRRMNEANARRARLVPGWVTVFGRVYHLGM